MDTIKKILKPSKKGDKTSSISDIGQPTNVERNIHVEKTEDGLVGLPEEFQNLLRHIIPEDELNEGNIKIGKDVLIWKTKFEKRGSKTLKYDFSQSDSGDTYSVGNSTFEIPSVSEEKHQPTDLPDDDNAKLKMPNDNLTNAGGSSPSPTTPVTIRKKSQRKNDNAGGPTLDKNMTEAQIMNEVKNLCENGHPLDKYTTDVELGAGAAGTVFLAVNKETKERVAIKKIDMVKQQKKEMILMEIKVI